MPAASSSAAEPAGGAPAAAVVGVAGPELAAAERRLIEAARPFGFILFARNCLHPAQGRQLGDLSEPGRPENTSDTLMETDDAS